MERWMGEWVDGKMDKWGEGWGMDSWQKDGWVDGWS